MSRIISMKVKAALAGAALLAGVGFAGTAFAQNDGSSGDGDLFLIVYDSTSGQTFLEDLGVQTGAVASDTAVNTAANAATGGHLSTSLPGYSATFAADSTLSSYLGSHSTDTFDWEVLANTGPTGQSTAANLLLTTAATPVSATFTNSTGGGFNNGNINANTLSLQGDIDNWSGSLATDTSGYLAAFGNAATLPGQGLDKGALTWYGSGDLTPALTWNPTSGTSTSNFYLATDATSGGGNTELNADIFDLGTVSLSSNGTLTFAGASPVPLPAALWLFGSGLLGLAAIARRRSTGAPGAAVAA